MRVCFFIPTEQSTDHTPGKVVSAAAGVCMSISYVVAFSGTMIRHTQVLIVVVSPMNSPVTHAWPCMLPAMAFISSFRNKYIKGFASNKPFHYA